MKRDPNEIQKIKYFKHIWVRRCVPIFYHKCCKCDMEYRLEPMYECSYEDHLFVDWQNYKYGCTECFSNKEEFRKYLEDEGFLLTKENYEYEMDYIKKMLGVRKLE